MPINKHVVVFILFMYDLGNTYSFAIFQSIFAIFLSLIDERESSIKKAKNRILVPNTKKNDPHI